MTSHHLPSAWNDMKMNDKIIWLLERARAQAEMTGIDDDAFVTASTFLDLRLYTYRNRISEMRPDLHLRGRDIIAQTIECRGEKVWAWRLTEYDPQGRMEL